MTVFTGTLVLIGVGAAFFGTLWVLGWMARRDRRIIRRENDSALGEIEISKLLWKCSNPVILGGVSVNLSGWRVDQSISEDQRKTLGFLQEALPRLIPPAITGGKEELKLSEVGDNIELVLEGVTIQKTENSFELSFKSSNRHDLLPWGLAVEFSGDKILQVEIVH